MSVVAFALVLTVPSAGAPPHTVPDDFFFFFFFFFYFFFFLFLRGLRSASPETASFALRLRVSR